jgi:3-dehydroquinate synthase II/3-amino-4-hydroxybenzoic acid synthase
MSASPFAVLDLDAAALMAKREKIKIRRLESQGTGAAAESLTLWYDARRATADAGVRSIVDRLANLRYTGVLIDAGAFPELSAQLPPRLDRIVHAADVAAWRGVVEHLPAPGAGGATHVVASPDAAVLAAAAAGGFATCYHAYVDDGASLHGAIEVGSRHSYLMIRFRDPTNIPLELVIASLQATETVLVKEINDPLDIEDAVVSLGVMEVGADGVMYSPTDHALLDQLTARLDGVEAPDVNIEVGTIVRSVPVGMGFRSCLDLATLFSPDEGMLVGSTSQGGILCCPEVFFLPYMELRPFRVNAGAVHSYVYNIGDRTDYMTELRAGASVQIVGADGRARKAVVGRVKTEVRPLRLIEVDFAGKDGEGARRVNVIMQDDWHVRVFSAEGQPRNITELKPGDKVLGHVAKPGRHVGIRVDERIIEE